MRRFVALASEAEARKVARIAIVQTKVCMGCVEPHAVPLGSTGLWLPVFRHTVGLCAADREKGRDGHVYGRYRRWVTEAIDRLLQNWRGPVKPFFVGREGVLETTYQYFLSAEERNQWVSAGPWRSLIDLPQSYHTGEDGTISWG
jgi:hypothetical protein